MPDEPRPRATPASTQGPRPSLGWPHLLAVAVLVAVGWLILSKMSEQSRMQDCFNSGRKNCAPLDPATGR